MSEADAYVKDLQDIQDMLDNLNAEVRFFFVVKRFECEHITRVYSGFYSLVY